MWLFALVAFLTNDIDSQSLKGVSLSVIYLILINPPALWLLKVISRHKRVYKYFSILINLLEIFGYTTIIYFLGGIESAYLTLMYAALITYVGIIAPRRFPFIIAVLCSVMFSLLVIGEHFGVIPHQRIVSYSDIPWLSQQFRLAVVIGLLFVVAYISSYTASLMKKNRSRLQRQNLELMETTAMLEKAEKKLQSDQQSLEIRVRERSAELAKANEDLQAELTDRKRAEEALKASEAQYRLLAEHMTDIVWMMDLDLKVTWLSPSAMKARGFSADEIAALPLDRQLTPESLGKAVNWLGKLMRLEKDGLISEPDGILSRELAFYCKDGRAIVLDCTFQFIRDEQGKATGILAEGKDITARKRAEEELLRTLESLRKTVSTTIQVMVSAVETRDPYTAGHQIRSADLARAIATEMGLPQDRIEGIRMAGSIHDIGKLSIPAEILSKPTKLSELEFSLIKEHARQGYEILKTVESPWALAEIVYQHHERMDGSGYPRSLKGDDILMEARILAVSDVVESMASHRPYRPALGIEAALEEIENNKGTLYDADAVDVCLRLFREKGFQLEGA
jgi:PAS domain S-box-containing protein